VINLAPADLRKEGPSFDLPIALALLVASGQLARPQLEGLWCAGELGLDGSLRSCRGVIALADQAHQQQARALIVPPSNASEASLIEGLPIRTAPNLRELVRQLKGEQPWPVIGCSGPQPSSHITDLEPWPHLDKSLASRALALSAAGGHHLLLVGPPGCGKTRLAHQLPQLLPLLSRKEALTITRIHSIAGHLHGIDQLQQQRPFRSPTTVARQQPCWEGDDLPVPANSAWPTVVCSSSMSWRNFRERCWISCGSPWNKASCRSAAPSRALSFPP
jgi:magnesium chelatase family protein